ncbi:sialic acid-binding Ig-like lectin 11 [Xyrichtys novacula]|uniref:Sialic acid-binding Ig-like lectin 11 n=1 Tax=Xyrichtys novacula TaxID=13765 RepID=A0AAV1F5N8_XYRNO|nr:sialic acid-binding Ig-like lectin 11 [Xyrichtys novacula]
MASILFATLLFLSKLRSCQLQCVKETLDDSEFSIFVTTHIQVVSGDCIMIPYEYTFPKSKVKVPHKKIWFRGDSQTTVSVTVVTNGEETKDLFKMDGLPCGEYEFGFKLEWECNQTYVFPTRVRVTVSALTQKPAVLVPPLKEGKTSRLICYALPLCSARAKIRWKSTKTSKNTSLMYSTVHMWQDEQDLYLTPSAYDHNTATITCVVEYENNIVAERTITLNVQFEPRFLNGSQCVVKGELLVCSCISWGNPPSPITWPVASFTDFSIKSHRKAEIVNSTLTLNRSDFLDTSINCVSSSKLGQKQIQIQIQNYTENMKTSKNSVNSNKKQTLKAGFSWILAVSVSLNLVLLSSLIFCIYKWGKRLQETQLGEMETYTDLNRAQVEQEYSVIFPQTG